MRQADPTLREIQRWIRESSAEGVHVFSAAAATAAVSESVRPITSAVSGTAPITGTAVCQMPEEDAARLRNEIPEALVLQDQPIELIRPTVARSTPAARKSPKNRQGIGLRAARNGGFSGTGQGVTVAVLDTGIDDTHPEIQGRVKASYEFDVPGWAVRHLAASRDTHGHGTHVAGLLAGTRVGVAPQADLVNGIMIPGGLGNLSDFILAMEAVVGEIGTPAQIINMSAGLVGFLPAMSEAVAGILAAGALPVFAVGNEGRNRTRSPGNFIDPLAVGACNKNKHVSSFSGSGVIVADNHQYSVPDLGRSRRRCLFVRGWWWIRGLAGNFDGYSPRFGNCGAGAGEVPADPGARSD